MLAIYKKEIKQYFNSVIACLYIAITTLFSGIFFVVSNISGGNPYINAAVYYSMYFMAISVPILTMRVFSDEYRQKTDQLLITAPVSIVKIVLGKFLALWTIMIIPMLLWSYYPLLLKQFGEVPMNMNYNGILGAVIYGTAILAIGMFVSSVTEIQVVAAIVGIGICLVGDFIPILNNIIGEKEYGIWKYFRMLVDALCLISPAEKYLNGMISVSSVVYYVTITVMFILFTLMMLKRRTGSATQKNTRKYYLKKAFVPIVLVAVIAVNVISTKAESKYEWMAKDITDNKLYELTDETREFLSEVKNDISIYCLGAESSADEYLAELLKRYDKASEHISVEYKNMDEYPSFYKDYTDDKPNEYSLIVVNNDNGKSKVIDKYNIYVTDMDYSTFQTIVKGYDGEGQVDSAINYVISDNNPKVRLVAGHNEYQLGDVFLNELDKMNFEIEKISLLNVDSIKLEECDLLIMTYPNTDYAKSEAEKVIEYLKKGGKAIMITGANSDFSEHPNFCSVAGCYGIEVNEGIVLENDEFHFIDNNNSYVVTTGGGEYAAEVENAFFPVSQGVKVKEADAQEESSISHSELLKTTDTAVCKMKNDFKSTEYEEGDIKGPFDLMVSAQDGETKLTVVASSYAFSDEVYYEVGEANLLLFKKMIRDNISTDNTISITQKKSSYSNLIINSAFSKYLGIFFSIIIPIIILLAGIVVWVRRRRK